jgi:hypothetical protein
METEGYAALPVPLKQICSKNLSGLILGDVRPLNCPPLKMIALQIFVATGPFCKQ